LQRAFFAGLACAFQFLAAQECEQALLESRADLCARQLRIVRAMFVGPSRFALK
jgi:hypothetical protein